MKSIVLVLLSAFSVAAFAQSSTSSTVLPETTTTTTTTESADPSASTITTEMPETEAPVTNASRGIRVSAWLPNVKSELGDQGESRIDRTFGVTVGYANLPVRRLGWIANVGLFEATEFSRDENAEDSEDSVTIARLDANLAFAITRYFYLKAGGNVSGFTQADSKEGFEPGFGYQGAVGVQLTEKVGFEIGWLEMAQIGVDENDGEDLKFNGIDFGITGTF